MQLILMASVAIIVLADGLVLLLYPVVFSAAPLPPNRRLYVAFFGFCALSILLACYLVDRQMTIQRLRHQTAEDRKRSSDALKQASGDLLQALPNYDSFQDCLPMEYRRAVSAKQELSVLVVTIHLLAAPAESTQATSALGDAARAPFTGNYESKSRFTFSRQATSGLFYLGLACLMRHEFARVFQKVWVMRPVPQIGSHTGLTHLATLTGLQVHTI